MSKVQQDEENFIELQLKDLAMLRQTSSILHGLPEEENSYNERVSETNKSKSTMPNQHENIIEICEELIEEDE